MIDRITELLENSSCSGWKLTIKETDGAQGYFILNRLEMMRGQKITEITLTVYKDFEEDATKYRGSMSIQLFPTMTDEEMTVKINRAVAGASAVKNRWYPLPSTSTAGTLHTGPVSRFGEHNVLDWISVLAEDVVRHKRERVDFNATEIFLSRNTYWFKNSEGITYSWDEYSGMVELVTTVRGAEGAVELFDIFRFSDYSPSWLDKKIETQINSALDRAESKPLPVLTDTPVLLGRAAVPEFFDYFRYQLTAKAVFQGVSSFKKGEIIRKNKDEMITISIVPYLERSPDNVVIDADGIVPREVIIVENNTVRDILSDIQFGTYLEQEITGISSNITVQPGNMITSDYEQTPYLEAVEFSDFTVDKITGDFGGEIRLAYYYDGKTRVPVTGGSVTGKIEDILDTFRMSEKIVTDGKYCGPEFLYLTGVNITGIGKDNHAR